MRLCQVCGKKLPRKNGKYCSKKCYGADKRQFKPCVICGKPLPKWPLVKKTCSRECFLKLRSQVNSGENNPRYKGVITKICPYCGEIFTHRRTEAPRKYCSKECSILAGAALRRNPNHWRYKGDRKRDKGQNWGQQSAKARRRDNYTCQLCGLTEAQLGQRLDVHHVRPYVLFNGDWESANHLDNLTSYCRSCHVKVELSKSS